jgi:hypothetical protein
MKEQNNYALDIILRRRMVGASMIAGKEQVPGTGVLPATVRPAIATRISRRFGSAARGLEAP